MSQYGGCEGSALREEICSLSWKFSPIRGQNSFWKSFVVHESKDVKIPEKERNCYQFLYLHCILDIYKN